MKPSWPELGVKLAVGAGFRLPDLSGLADGVVPGPQREGRTESVHYDTPDLRLARWGLSLRHRRGEGWTLGFPPNAHQPLARHRTQRFEGSPRTPPAAALSLLRAYLRGAEVRPAASLSILRRQVLLTGPEGQELAEVIDDEVSVLEGRRVASRFREVEIEVREGGEVLLPSLLARLQEAGAFPADGVPAHLRALGPAAQEPPELTGVALPPSPTGTDLVRSAISSGVASILKHDIGIRLGGDPEDVHQARVATRRLRSNLRTFQPLLQEEWATGLRDELGWLADQLGSVRDAEVLRDRLREEAKGLLEADARPSDGLLRRLDEDVERARERLLTTLDEQRYVDLLNRLVEAAAQPAVTEDAALPAGEVLPPQVRKPWRKLRSAARALRPDSPDEELHHTRILAKRARYAAEAAAPAVGSEAERFAKVAAGLQTVLGEHQDAVIAQGWLRANAGGGRRAFVAGQLFGREADRAAASRADWPRAWKRLNQKKLRAWLPA
ncbi:MAG: CHAD domain containing protein [Candidatus Nephthysia bennettiae]|nr:MAG: CHAD domain containing protein [Candidatus Dormibacteraeota bacterium]